MKNFSFNGIPYTLSEPTEDALYVYCLCFIGNCTLTMRKGKTLQITQLKLDAELLKLLGMESKEEFCECYLQGVEMVHIMIGEIPEWVIPVEEGQSLRFMVLY